MSATSEARHPLLEEANISPLRGNANGIRVEVDETTGHPFQNFCAAVLCCFLSVTGGVALGGYIFPSDELHPNADFQVVGMQIGLLASSVSSWVAYLRSDVYCGVPGGIFPPVIALGSTYFKRVGPENPHTIMFALPLITLVQGVLLYLVARLPLERLVKGVPYVVFCGFLAGTGVVCVRGGLEMAAGAPLVEGRFWGAAPRWLPPLLTATVVHGCQRFGTPMAEALLPVGLLLLALGLYTALWLSNGGVDLEWARREGLLYNFGAPSAMSFYRVWSLQDLGCVRWDYLLDSSFLTALVNSFALSVLCIVEDLYGVVEATGLKVNFRKELESTALMNVLSGAAGAMPTNLVMSYSVTAHRSGAASRPFLLYLSILSSLFFLAADSILSLTPIMVPAAALIWVGIAMCWDTVYHGARRLSRADYAVVWMMIALDVARGPNDMLVAGLCVTCLQLAYRLSAIEVFGAEHTSRTERSATMYPLGKDALLEEHGDTVLILHLAKGLLFFGSAFQIQERVERRLAACRESGDKFHFLVLDLTQLETTEVSGIKVLHFIVHELAEEHGFTVVLVGLQDKVRRQLERFCGSTDALSKYAKMNEALRYVENQLFEYRFRDRGDVQKGTLRNRNLADVRLFVKSVIGDSEFLPVAVDVHSWLNNYTREYVAEQVLPCLVGALTCRRLEKGTDVCVTRSSADNINAELGERAPLVWVLSGRVDLLHDVQATFERSLGPCAFVEVRGAGRSRRWPGDVLQIAEAGEGPAGERPCAGPLDTFSHFFGAFQMPPATARVASEEATVALLTYSRFEGLPRSVARLLEHYTAKKRFVAGAMSRA